MSIGRATWWVAAAALALGASAGGAEPEQTPAEKSPPGGGSVCSLAISGSRVVECKSEWHKIRLTSKVGGGLILLPDDAQKLLPPAKPAGRGEKTWRVPDALATSLARRIFNGMRLAPDDPDKMAQWLGSGTRPEAPDTVEGGGQLGGTLSAAKAGDAKNRRSVTYQGVLVVRHRSALASRFGPNTHEADWILKVRGELTFDPETRQIVSGRLTAEGTVAGRYHNNGAMNEPYTETVRLVLAVAAPLSKETLDRIAALIRQLGDNSYRKREAASAALRKIGLPAKGLLRAALKSDDPEIQSRAQQLLDEFDPPKPTPNLLDQRLRNQNGLDIFITT